MISSKYRRVWKGFAFTLIAALLMPVAGVFAVDKQNLSAQGSASARLQALQTGKKLTLSYGEIQDLVNASDNVDEGYIRVAFKKNSKPDQIGKTLSNLGGDKISRFITLDNVKMTTVKLSEEESVVDALYRFNQDPNVVVVEPVYERKIFWTPNDPQFSSQWHMATPGDGEYSLDMPNAWDYVDAQLDTLLGAGDHYGGDSDVVVAVLDTGLAYQAWTDEVGYTYAADPDGPVNVWHKSSDPDGDANGDNCPGECGVDDDGDGLIDEDTFGYPATSPYYMNDADRDDDENGINDDNYGWDLFDWSGGPGGTAVGGGNDGHPNDNQGHGTFVSNVIASNTNNGTSGAGIASNVTIMALKVGNEEGVVSGGWTEALFYAVEEGNIDVANMSFGGNTYSAYEDAVVTYLAEYEDVVLVAASGNYPSELAPTVTTPQFPASYGSVISVGATDQNGSRSSYSVYGGIVDLAAPVDDTNGYLQQGYTCYFPDDCTDTYTSFSFDGSMGTSFAAPQVSAVAALIRSVHPDWDVSQVRYALRKGSNHPGSDVYTEQLGFGILNANHALTSIPAGEEDYDLFFTWNDTSVDEKSAWHLIGVPGESYPVSASVIINDYYMGSYEIDPGDNVTPQYRDLMGGPVRIVANNSLPIYATQRVLYRGSFNEFAGIPASSLDTKYYFTWNDTSISEKRAWNLVGNPSDKETAEVTITIAGNEMGSYSILPGGSVQPQYLGIMGGPVEIESTNGVPIYATQRVLYRGSFNEFAGIPASSLDTKYYFTWNDTSTSTKRAWNLVGNPSDTETAEVTITIGGTEMGSYSIAPGESIQPQYLGIMGGPVEIESTNGVPIYATQRVLYRGSFNEFAGIPASSLDTKYYFTWNDTSVSTKRAWNLVGNPSDTETAEVTITIGGTEMGSYSIAPGESIQPQYLGIMGGPVEIESTNGVPIYTTQRVLYRGSFNEFAGIAVEIPNMGPDIN